MAARAGDAPLKDPVAEAAAAPTTCRRRRLLTEEDILHLSLRRESDRVVDGVWVHISRGRLQHVPGLSAAEVAPYVPQGDDIAAWLRKEARGDRNLGPFESRPIGPLHSYMGWINGYERCLCLVLRHEMLGCCRMYVRPAP